MSESVQSFRRWSVAGSLLLLLAAALHFGIIRSQEARASRLPGVVTQLAERPCVGGACACAVVEFVDPAARSLRFTSTYCRPSGSYFEDGRYWPGTDVAVIWEPGSAPQLDDRWLRYNAPRGLAILGIAGLLVALPRGWRRPRGPVRA